MLIESAMHDTFKKHGNTKFKLCRINGQYITSEANCIGLVKKELKNAAINESGEDEEMDEDEDEEDESEDNIVNNIEVISKSIVELSRNYCLFFLMEEFHVITKFAKKTVYHIVDTAHVNKVNCVVIGVTPSITISDDIDRRIKSRFLHRQVYTFLPQNVKEVQQIIMYYMALPTNHPENIKCKETVFRCLNDSSVKSILTRSLAKSNVHFYFAWIKSLITTFKGSLSSLEPHHFIQSFEKMDQNDRVCMIKDLTLLEFNVLMSIKHIEENGTTKYNFEDIYSEYIKFITGGAQTTNINQKDVFHDKLIVSFTIDRNIVYKAFDRLIDLKFIKVSSARLTKKYTAGVRLNELHPSEIQNFVVKNKDFFSTEQYRYATE
ncbi:origin recognition complex subunit 4 [Acrasis kona]|uniref:Origin recognition complex subunit 4 n=1 Tax=Acrasis kona TaxID=1008807 RepID=A0AAW2Z2D0_9EUKA